MAFEAVASRVVSATAFSGLGTGLYRYLIAPLVRLYLRRRLYRTLSDLSDHMLADIGIHRGEIRRVSDSGYPVFDPVEASTLHFNWSLTGRR